jgi:starch synthase (maltosyl-transferring)
MIPAIKRILIENVQPQLDCGRYPIKRETDDTVEVTADIFGDGHGQIRSILKYKTANEKIWHEVPMSLENPGLDFWSGEFTIKETGFHEYTIESFPAVFETWLTDAAKKQKAGELLFSDLAEGIAYARENGSRARGADNQLIVAMIEKVEKTKNIQEQLELLSQKEFCEIMGKYPNRSDSAIYNPVLRVWVDRPKARFASWYEMFPRSQGTKPGQSATFSDCVARLPEIKEMGFDVIYFPPIHPIGNTKRKGPNNSLIAGPDDPGCPYSIGNEHGGHMAVEPSLGGMKGFENFAKACKKAEMEIAFDLALNCSPDHSYLKEHPQWFARRADGVIKYAENPPKKYEDIYPFDFNSSDKEGLWNEIKKIILFWAAKGVRIFRVDNPHTKPILFWEWLILETQKEYPDLIFLSEAFTRPKVMKALAKAGFTQSYT